MRKRSRLVIQNMASGLTGMIADGGNPWVHHERNRGGRRGVSCQQIWRWMAYALRTSMESTGVPRRIHEEYGTYRVSGNGADGKDDRGNYGTEVNEREGWHEGRQEARKQ